MSKVTHKSKKHTAPPSTQKSTPVPEAPVSETRPKPLGSAPVTYDDLARCLETNKRLEARLTEAEGSKKRAHAHACAALEDLVATLTSDVEDLYNAAPEGSVDEMDAHDRAYHDTRSTILHIVSAVSEIVGWLKPATDPAVGAQGEVQS